jgi:phosphoadenosine phosphosulfate reductase
MLESSIKAIADGVEFAIVFFSCGKDATTMLSLFNKYMPKRYKAIFLYIHKGLSIREKIITYYENRFKIKIDQYPKFDVAFMFKKKLKQPDIEAFIRDKYDCEWLAYGYRKDESLQRRGMLKHIGNGIDYKYKKLYPLSDWKQSDVWKYIKAEKLILPPDYAAGFRDINIFKGDALLWLYREYYNDYLIIKDQYPDIEGELLKAQSDE